MCSIKELKEMNKHGYAPLHVVCMDSHGNPHPVIFRMLSQETTENITWILEVLQCYTNDVFGRAETVLVDKD